MAKRLHIIFFGDVHGMGYRFFIQQKALDLGLKGYCHITEQNKIEVEVEGKNNSIDEFLKFIQKGVSLQSESNSFNLEIFDELKGYRTMVSDIV